MEFALLAILTFAVLLGVPFALSRQRRSFYRNTVTLHFDLVKCVVGIICVLMLVGVIGISPAGTVALVLASMCELKFSWSR